MSNSHCRTLRLRFGPTCSSSQSDFSPFPQRGRALKSTLQLWPQLQPSPCVRKAQAAAATRSPADFLPHGDKTHTALSVLATFVCSGQWYSALSCCHTTITTARLQNFLIFPVRHQLPNSPRPHLCPFYLCESDCSTQQLNFCVWLMSPSITSPRFIHAVGVPFPFKAEYYSIVCRCPILFTCWSLDSQVAPLFGYCESCGCVFISD